MGIDSKALLDHALFQLTPTRTRCDLVVFGGGISEKLASGLVEPFICHMKFFKEQIPKGGYSITLQPPKSGSFWFTKSTIQRFVRFVSTPEVLERFARLEKEISQIESSVQPNEIATSNGVGHGDEGSLPIADGVTKPSPKSSKKGEANGSEDDVQEENSKVRLQRVLESRKALLRKEQAMAYARALVAGYDFENIDNLIKFADAFGASRLREACTEFKELCKKKHTDGVWLDELAAMQASGIIIAPENNPNLLQFPNNGKLTPNGSMDLSSESAGSQENSLNASDQQSNPQGQMQWPNQMPQYMFNPYQPYPFPYYPPGNMPWPQNMDDSSRGLSRNQRTSSRKKDKSSASEEHATSGEDEQTESGDSDTGSEIDSSSARRERKKLPKDKKKNKKSSKTVVIRNINYITSKRRDDEYSDSSSVEDDLIDEDSIRQKVEDAVGSLEKHHKTSSNRKKRSEDNKIQIFENGSYVSADQEPGNDDISGGGKPNGTWDAFQNLLLTRETESTDNREQFQQHRDVMDGDFAKSSRNFDSERIQRRQSMDSFIVNGRNDVNEGRANAEDFANPQTFRPSMKRSDFPEDALLFPQRSAESGRNAVSDFGTDSSRIRNGRGEDWFVANHSDASTNGGAIFDQSLLSGGYAKPSEENHPKAEETKKVVPIDDSFMVQTSYDSQYDSQWKTDISMVSDLIVDQKPETKKEDSYEPDDLCVMLSRASEGVPVGASWSSDQMDFGAEAAFTEAIRKPSVVETSDEVEEKAAVNGKSVNGKNGKNPPGKQLRSKSLPGSLSKTKPGALPKSQKPFTSRPLVQKSKFEKEEEARRKIEEVALERQRRIAERSAASGGKKVPVVSKSASLKSAPVKKATA